MADDGPTTAPTKRSAGRDLPAAIAVELAITADIAVELAAMRRIWPGRLSSALNAAARSLSASSVCICAPLVVPRATALSKRTARII